MTNQSSSQKNSDTWKVYSEHPISHTTVHYLKAIAAISKEQGYTRLTDLAEFLDISAGSCHTTLNKLKKKLFVEEDKNKFIKLTKKGEFVVQEITKFDQLLFTFFNKVLGVSAAQAEIDACKIEHLISRETASKLEEFLAKLDS